MNEQELITRYFKKLEELAEISDQNRRLVLEAQELLWEWLKIAKGMVEDMKEKVDENSGQ